MSDARKRANRALHRLNREPVLSTRQLWQVGAGNATLRELEREGFIWTLGTLTPNAEVWALTYERSHPELDARLREPTY
jgi:hypothetical protein